MRLSLLLIIISTTLSCGQSGKEKRAMKEMSNWLESPMELDEKPKTISVRDSRELFWPSDENIDAYLINFTDSEDNEHIGFTGPITWCFFGIDFSKLSNEELYNLYTGWYISFLSYQQQDPDDTRLLAGKASIEKKLNDSGFQEIKFETMVVIANEAFFEVKVSKDKENRVFVGTATELHELSSDIVLPFYKLIGEMWGPLESE